MTRLYGKVAFIEALLYVGRSCMEIQHTLYVSEWLTYYFGNRPRLNPNIKLHVFIFWRVFNIPNIGKTMSLDLITKSYPPDCCDHIGRMVKALWSCLHFEYSELFLQIWNIIQCYQWSRSDGFKGPLHIFMYECINNEMYMYMHRCFLAPQACVWILKEGVSLTSYMLLNAIINCFFQFWMTWMPNHLMLRGNFSTIALSQLEMI